jgi:hypothetical protein
MRISLFRKAVLFGALALAPVAANAQAPTDESGTTDQAADKASQSADKARDDASKSTDKAKDSAGAASDKAKDKTATPPTQETDTPTGGEKPTTDETTKEMR